MSKLLEDIKKLRDETPGAGYLQARPDLKKAMEKLGENTIVHGEEIWGDQINENWPYLEKYKGFGHLEGFGVDKTCIIAGASPALKKNYKALKEIEGEYRNRFILIAVNSVAEFLITNGIKPDIIVSVDCDEEVWTRDLSKVNSEDLTLLCSPFTWPEVAKKWKGKLHFIPMGCKDEELQEKTMKVLGALQIVPGCGNAFNEAVYVSWHIFHCKNYIFVGSELSWEDEGSYYVDGKHSNDEEDKGIPKIRSTDIWGKTVITTPGHWVFKLWLEQLASVAPGVFINATEAGILGISPEDGVLPFIKQFYLGKAIRYIKQIHEDAKDWHYMEAMKYNLAWMRGYSVAGIPSKLMVESIAPKTILDVGCGDGSTVDELIEKGYDAYGVEMAYVPAEKWNGKARCQLAFADNIPAEDNWFDLALTDILEHQPPEHVDKIIKEVARVSKKQLFNIEFDNAQWAIDGRIDPHLTKRPPQWWKKELRCGLKIVATSGTRTFVTEKK
ncbi:MAG: 6-hydroxymethylpterin diphosphokinase MptE-like protein [Planctomycetota bacterium]|jgi:hypothetical protein